MKHLSLLWYTTLQTLLWLKGRYIEALNCGIPRYKPYYGSRGGTLKHFKGTLKHLTMVYHVTNLVMYTTFKAQGEVH